MPAPAGRRSPMDERVGEAFELDERLTVVGRKLEVGEQAPAFELEGVDPADGSIHPVRLGDSAGAVLLLNVVNSVDTPVCDVETKRWDALGPDFPQSARIVTVSMDVPYGIARCLREAA